MFVRQLMFAAFVGVVIAGAGCSCCRGTRAAYPSCGCGPAVPAGPIAVPAPPAPIASGYITTAPCPNCVGR